MHFLCHNVHMKEVYISLDIETDGPCPGMNSMLSLGAVAVHETRGVLGEFSRNVQCVPGAQPDTRTMTEFWSRFPTQYAATRMDALPAAEVMTEFRTWVQSLGGIPVAVAMPAGFDFSWMWYYLNRFGSDCPFSFSCIDIKTMAWCLMGGNYRHATKRNWPTYWFSKMPHTHVAIEDAREQADIFQRMLVDMRSRGT